MVPFSDRLSNFWTATRDRTFNLVKPFSDRKRKREDSGDDPSRPAGATSPPKRQATPPAQQRHQQSQPQPLHNGLSHRQKQPAEAAAAPAARQLFSPGYVTEQRRSSGRFPPQQRPIARRLAAAPQRAAVQSPNGKLSAARQQLASTRLSPVSAGYAASPYVTPAHRANGWVAPAAGFGKSPRTNGALQEDTAAAIRRCTRTRDSLTPRRVHGPGAASRGFGVQMQPLATPGFGSGDMSQQQQPQQQQPQQTPMSSQAQLIMRCCCAKLCKFMLLHTCRMKHSVLTSLLPGAACYSCALPLSCSRVPEIRLLLTSTYICDVFVEPKCVHGV